MNYEKIARNLVRYYWSNKQIGHTQAMLNGSKNTPDCLVMAADHRQTKFFGVQPDHSVTLQTVENDKLLARRAPLVIDHHTQTLIWTGLLDEIDKLRSQIVKEKSS